MFKNDPAYTSLSEIPLCSENKEQEERLGGGITVYPGITSTQVVGTAILETFNILGDKVLEG